MLKKAAIALFIVTVVVGSVCCIVGMILSDGGDFRSTPEAARVAVGGALLVIAAVSGQAAYRVYVKRKIYAVVSTGIRPVELMDDWYKLGPRGFPRLIF